MADLRIVDAPLLSTVKGTEKLPTGGEGNFSVSVNQVADFAKLKWSLATEGYVDNAVGNVQADLNLHKNNSSNPHQVTKTQVGLGNVDNTADLDKPVSNATQSAIITANSGKADKSYVDSQDQLKADKTTVEASLLLKADKVDLKASKILSDGNQTQQSINDFGGAKWYAKSGGYELGATVKLTNGDTVKSTVPNNIVDPNIDMTGWVLVSSDGQIQTWSGRTQEEKNKELISAQDYGAKGDGVTNDSTAFNSLESVYSGRIVDLQGKTYKVDRDFTKNNYINGSFRVVNSNKGKGLVTSAGSKYTFSTKNGQKIGELIPPLFDSEVQTNSTIIQSCFYNKRNNRIIGQRVLRSVNGTAESVIDFYDYGKISAYPTPTFTSKPTSIIGHQSIGYTDKSDIYYAVTGDIKDQEKSKHITSFTLNMTSGDFENIKYLKVFGDDFSGSGNNCMCVSQSGKLLCVTGSHPSKGRYVRVFDLTQMTTEGDYSDKYLVEFGFAFHSGFDPQSICCDDENIYILHGTSGSNSKVEVFTIAGSYVATDHEFAVGSYDATLLPYYYYEPECLFIGDQGRLMACVAVGKKGGANARDSYTNLISSVNFQETLQLATDGARPLVTLNATKTIAHTKPITYSYLGSDGSLNTYLSVSSGATAYTPASGGYALSLTVAGTAQPQIRLKNSLHDGLLQVSTSGIFGLFSLTTGKWVCGVDTLGVIQMQYDIKVAGAVLPSSTVGAYKIGGTDNIWGSSYVKSRYYTATVFDTYGTGSPEGVLVAGVGSTYRNTLGGAGTTFYVKETGTGNTGWVAK